MYRILFPLFALVALLILTGCRNGPSPNSLPVKKGVLENGEVLAFSHASLLGGLADIYLIDSNQGIRLAGEPKKYDTGPLWSPDGSQLIYMGSFGWEADLFLLDIESRESHQITQDGYYKYSPRWSPDGEYLAYLNTEDPEHPSLHPELLNNLELSTGENHTIEFERVLDYRWLPESQSIFTLAKTDVGFSAYKVNLDGSREKLNARLNFLEEAVYVSLSPDSSMAAYVVPATDPDALVDPLYVASIDGSGEYEVGSFAIDSSMVWSPDGERLAFVTFDEDYRYALYVVNADRSGLKELLVLDTGDDSGEILPGTPAWSADSQKLAIGSYTSWQGTAVYVLNMNGSEIRQVIGPAGLIFGISWRP